MLSVFLPDEDMAPWDVLQDKEPHTHTPGRF